MELLVLLIGSKISNKFRDYFRILNVDYEQDNKNDLFYKLSKSNSFDVNKNNLLSFINDSFSKEYQLKNIICTAGGFEMNSISSPDIFNSYIKMFKMNSEPSILSSVVASKFLNKNGNLIFTGALSTFKNPMPSMLSYSLAKNFVHSLNISLSQDQDFVLKNISTYCLLPGTIDTETNRNAMPDADKSQWLKPEGIAENVFMVCQSANKPTSGSFIELFNVDGFVNMKII